MKWFKYISFLLLLLFVAHLSNAKGVFVDEKKPVQDTSLISALRAIDLSQYNGQPVDSLIANLPIGYTDLKITGWRSIRVAEILHVIYPNRVVVEIHVRNFQHMNPNWVNTSNPIQNWNVSLFKKEAISYTVIFNVSECINGCANEFK